MVRFKFDFSQPVGVGSRNSNNELIKETLGWEPPTSLEDDGTRLMGQWIRQEVEMTLEGYQDGDAVLRDLQLSKKVDLRAGRIIFAVHIVIGEDDEYLLLSGMESYSKVEMVLQARAYKMPLCTLTES